MSADKLRVKDIMNALDKDQDGSCSRSEFRQVLPMLGFDMSQPAALDNLFDTFDADRGGSVDFNELHQLLRKTFEPDNLNGEEDAAREAASMKLQAIQRGRNERKKRRRSLLEAPPAAVA